MSVGLVDVRIHVRWRAWAERVSNVFGVPLLGHCTVSLHLGQLFFTSMVSFDEALCALVCDARFGRDPCASLIWLLCFISFCGLCVNFLPRCSVYSRVTNSCGAVICFFMRADRGRTYGVYARLCHPAA